MNNKSAEQIRLYNNATKEVPLEKWGPYLSERQWGTVREDYSENGDAWNYFTHDQARSRAYNWGEDGIGGISDYMQNICFAVALWNGKDPILKERLFGLTNGEGIHGEDVKELYYYLDNVPTHYYMKYLYKYPQASFPYLDLIEKNWSLSKKDPEYEILDTGIFNDNKYFDVFIELCKLELIFPFKWMSWTAGTINLNNKEYDYKDCSLLELSMYITYIFRADKFTPGTKEEIFKKGTFDKILIRLKENLIY
jgi:hypothetical protein